MRIYSIEELLQFPEPVWLVEPFIVDNGITVLFGKAKSFKSFVAIDWAARTKGLAVYISGEGSPRRFGERLTAWETAAGTRSDVLVHPSSIDLLTNGDAVSAALAELGDPIRLLVVDTVSRNMVGNENSTEDMSKFVAVLDRLRFEFECAVLVVHHTGLEHDDRERGSSALRGAADVSVRARREDGLAVKLSCAAIRDAAEFEPRTVRLIDVDGQLVAAGAVTRTELIDDRVREVLAGDPHASANMVVGAVDGRREDVLEAIRRIRSEVVPVVPNARNHPEQGGSQGGGSLREPPRNHAPTLNDVLTGEGAEESIAANGLVDVTDDYDDGDLDRWPR